MIPVAIENAIVHKLLEKQFSCIDIRIFIVNRLIFLFQQPSQTPNMNVYKAWEKGFTGAGVNVTFIDDGIDKEHPDLMQNYVSNTLKNDDHYSIKER